MGSRFKIGDARELQSMVSGLRRTPGFHSSSLDAVSRSMNIMDHYNENLRGKGTDLLNARRAFVLAIEEPNGSPFRDSAMGQLLGNLTDGDGRRTSETARILRWTLRRGTARGTRTANIIVDGAQRELERKKKAVQSITCEYRRA